MEHPAKSTTLHSRSKALQSLLGGKDAHFVCQQEDPSKQENRAHFHLPAPQNVLTITAQSRYFNRSPYHQHHQSTNSHSPNTSHHKTQLAFLTLLFSATSTSTTVFHAPFVDHLSVFQRQSFSSLQFFLNLLIAAVTRAGRFSVEHYLPGSLSSLSCTAWRLQYGMNSKPPPVVDFSRYSFLWSL